LADQVLINEDREMQGGGRRLRALRERLGLTVRQVQERSEKLAEKYKQPNYFIDKARLSDIEVKAILPNIYKIFALASIYHRSVPELLGFYGIETENLTSDIAESPLPQTHLGGRLRAAVRIPTKIESGFTIPETTDFGRLISSWGTVPLAFLAKYEHSDALFGYIGTEDWTMYPLIPPGSFVEVNVSMRRVAAGPWTSEHHRPIYFVETREKMLCGWCEIDGNTLLVVPHPLSPERVRSFRKDVDAEIVGTVVAVATRRDHFGVQQSPSSPAQTGSIQDVLVKHRTTP
jgi:transcriptional regulator with XRE-family HTH domain